MEAGYSAPSKKEVDEFRKKFDRRADNLLDMMVKRSPEINELIRTGIGWELIKHDVERCQFVVEKVLSGEATEMEKGEAKYLYFNRIPHVAGLINDWVRGLDVIANGGKK